MKIASGMKAFVAIFALAAMAGCASLQGDAGSAGTNLAADVQSRLSDDSVTSRLTVGVAENQGVITLTGQIRDSGAKARAVAIARGTPGVRDVVDQTTR